MWVGQGDLGTVWAELRHRGENRFLRQSGRGRLSEGPSQGEEGTGVGGQVRGVLPVGGAA